MSRYLWMANWYAAYHPMPRERKISIPRAHYIGRRPSGERWKGILDEIRVYNRVLTEAEIEQNFEARGGLAHAVELGGKLAISWGRIKDSR